MIPLIIHQTWKTSKIPSRYATLQHSWQALHPAWDYRLWTDADNRAFLEEHYPWFLPLYDGYAENIMRADAVRYFLLAHYGGIYADLDMRCLRPFDTLLADKQLILVPEPASHVQKEVVRERGLKRLIGNAFMASAPGHPFWLHLFRELVANRDAAGPLDATGPFLLTRAYNSYAGAGPVTLLPSEYVFPLDNIVEPGPEIPDEDDQWPDAYAVHYWQGSWVRRTPQRRTWFERTYATYRRWRDRGAYAVSVIRRTVAPILNEKLATAEILSRPFRLNIKRRWPARPLFERWPPFATTNGADPVPSDSMASGQFSATGRGQIRLKHYPPVLILCPVKNAAAHLPHFWHNLHTLSYPCDRISLAHLVSDSDDGTYALIQDRLLSLRRDFARVELYEQNFDYRWRLSRWEPSEQPRRRAILARSRNHLLSRALADETWVLWIDADLLSWPADIIERLLATGKKIVAPHCVNEDGHTYDLNSFRFTPDADKIEWRQYTYDGVMLPPPNVGRVYLGQLRHYDMVPLDGVGGAMLLVHADVHREGLIFPPYAYRGLIETEGLTMMAGDMGYTCWGLPNVEVVHPTR